MSDYSGARRLAADVGVNMRVWVNTAPLLREAVVYEEPPASDGRRAMTRPSAMTDDLAWAEAITLRLADSLPDSDERADYASPQAPDIPEQGGRQVPGSGRD